MVFIDMGPRRWWRIWFWILSRRMEIGEEGGGGSGRWIFRRLWKGAMGRLNSGQLQQLIQIRGVQVKPLIRKYEADYSVGDRPGGQRGKPSIGDRHDITAWPRPERRVCSMDGTDS